MLRLGLLSLAGWALHRELADVRMGELVRHFAAYGARHVSLAIVCTIGSFLTLGEIERLALRSTVPFKRIPRSTAALTAFVAHAFSQSVGVALLTGAAVRLRGYARDGLDAAAVGRASAFVTLTVTLGLLACGAGALLTSTRSLQLAGVTLPVRPLGLMLALLVMLYLGWSFTSTRDHMGQGRWRMRRPTGGVALAQLLLASVDWLLSATVLFAVLPAEAALGYGELLRAYLVAQTVGMVSHVPGGAGVLEVVVLALVTGRDPTRRGAVIAALVMFRVVYYVVPLLLAVAVALIAELRRHREDVTRWSPVGVEPIVLKRVG